MNSRGKFVRKFVRKFARNFAAKLLAVAVGAIVYYLVLQIVLWLGLNTNDLKLLSALVVAVFLALPTMKKQYFQKKTSNGGAGRA